MPFRQNSQMTRIARCLSAPHHHAIVAGLVLATIGISRTLAQDEEAVDPNNPAIGAEVLRLPGLQDLGRRSSGAQVEVLLALRFNHPDQLQQLVWEQSDRDSPNYHQYLTPDQFSERF